jgi:hypothetical protein
MRRSISPLPKKASVQKQHSPGTGALISAAAHTQRLPSWAITAGNTRRIHQPATLAFAVAVAFLLAAPRTAGAQQVTPVNLVDQAQKQVVTYITKLADLHCIEDVVQEKLKPNGGTELSSKSQYDYFLYMQGNSYDFQLSESRLEVGTQKPAHQPLLLTNGFSTLLLVFHPYYRSAFEFTAGPEETLDGHSVIPVHFAHIQGARSPAAMALRGREFPLELEGTAWLEANSGQVVRMDAGLEREMTDVGMKSLKIRVDYMPSPKASDHFMVPAKAVVDLETPRQHWRNIHTFHNYKLFSTEANQDPDVKVKATKESPADPNAAPAPASPNKSSDAPKN